MFYLLHFITCSGSTLKNISYTELRKHILNCDTSVLTENLLQSLIQVSTELFTVSETPLLLQAVLAHTRSTKEAGGAQSRI